jgi:hypothetical protein
MAIGLEHRPQNTSANATRLKSSVGSIRRPSSLCEGILIGPPDHQAQVHSSLIVTKPWRPYSRFYHDGFVAVVVRITFLQSMAG